MKYKLEKESFFPQLLPRQLKMLNNPLRLPRWHKVFLNPASLARICNPSRSVFRSPERCLPSGPLFCFPLVPKLTKVGHYDFDAESVPIIDTIYTLRCIIVLAPLAFVDDGIDKSGTLLNLSLEQIEKRDARISSRILKDCKVIELK